MKKVLITGKTSYIGRSFKAYIERNYPNEFQVDSISVRGEKWRRYDFSKYDVVLQLAGKAHADVKNVSKQEQQEYYVINKDLAKEVAIKYKRERHGFSQFIYFSSIIVYGTGENKITANTKPNPDNFYGDSKIQAEHALMELVSENFQILIIRPPMVYGPGSRGNFQTLVKLALKLPFFPKINNSRSMIYVDNLSEFIRRLVLSKSKTNRYFPQNLNYVNTSNLVKQIRAEENKKTLLVIGFNGLLKLLLNKNTALSRYLDKAFGTLVYDKSLSETTKIKLEDYQNTDFYKSVGKSVKNIF
ncbi:NAD-dependent epimerase/dehydratase family protein [Pediococcus ethanolidurans]|uniref:NAD-dependent epimerase/dehydratase family protein n=1 Tax=Pediococcus ethanolidurans TaxID=319653 RepID=UPI001C1EBC80|nr:NAD-dependent epimerase/dehydratase family protein [Pediococcus ethanolidurans]MBU7554184.1 NAD-dependent epimerase/dehydratase family protein [Pediococcus ethanolidurans]